MDSSAFDFQGKRKGIPAQNRPLFSTGLKVRSFEAFSVHVYKWKSIADALSLPAGDWGWLQKKTVIESDPIYLWLSETFLNWK